jgi:hypothetical protein
MLTTITAPPNNTVDFGAPITSSDATISHAQRNPKTEITKRASCDTLGHATAAASTSNTATFANTAQRPTEDVMDAAPRPTDHSGHRPQENLPGGRADARGGPVARWFAKARALT